MLFFALVANVIAFTALGLAWNLRKELRIFRATLVRVAEQSLLNNAAVFGDLDIEHAAILPIPLQRAMIEADEYGRRWRGGGMGDDAPQQSGVGFRVPATRKKSTTH